MIRYSTCVRFLHFYTLLSLIIFYVPMHGMSKIWDENGSDSRGREELSKLRTSSRRKVDNVEIPNKVEGATEITESIFADSERSEISMIKDAKKPKSIPEEVRAESEKESAQIRKQLESHIRRKGQWWKLDFVPSIAELTVLAASPNTYVGRVAAAVKKVLSLVAAGLIQENYMIHDMSSGESPFKREERVAPLVEKTYVSMTILPAIGKVLITAVSHPAVPLAAAAVAAKVHDVATAKPSSTPLTTNPKASDTTSPKIPETLKPSERVQNASLLPQEFSKFSNNLSVGGDVKVDKSALAKPSSTPLTTNPKGGDTTSPKIPENLKPSERVQNATFLPQEFSKLSNSLSMSGDVKVDKNVLANSLQKNSAPITTNPKIGDPTSPKIPETLKPSEPVQNEKRMPQESNVLFRTVSTLSGQSDLKKEENAFKKESSTFGATTEDTKKLNLVQSHNTEKVSHPLPAEANKVVAPKAEIPSATKNNTQKMLGANKPVETSTLKQSTANDAAFIAPTCSLPAPNFGQSTQPSGYSAGMKDSQFTVQVPLSKDMNGSVSANPLEMIQLAGALVVEACQFVSESGKYSSEVQKDTIKQEIQQSLDAQIEANTKHKMIYAAMDGGFYDAAKVAEADTLFVQMQTLNVRSRLQGNDRTPEMRACNELYQATSDKYTEMYRQHGHLMRRSDEETREAASQAIYKALEYAKTAPAISEKARTIAIKDCENQIRVRNQQEAEYKEVKAQAALGVIQPISESHVEQSREAKKPSKEQKIKQQAEQVVTGSPNGGPKKSDEDKKERKTNKLSKTEAAEKIKDRYESTGDKGKYRLREGKEGLKDKNGKEIKTLRWDHTHQDWEIYNSKDCRAGDHMGSMDAETFETYKESLPNRSDRI